MNKLKYMFIVIIMFSFGAIPGVSNAALTSGEREALEAFYTSTGGASWSDNTNWMSSGVSECLWEGITCNVDGDHVTNIELSGNNLNGQISSYINSLTGLQWVDLSDNPLLSGSIPVMSDLTDLRHLNLSSCNLTGSIPDLSANDLLIYINLSNNGLTGSIPTSLSDVDSLQDLRLANNNLSGFISIPIGQGNLPYLTTLDLGGNQISGTISTNILYLIGLKYLYIDGNILSGPFPSGFSTLGLINAGSDFRYNAFDISDSVIQDFLDQKQWTGDWDATQTVAPTNLMVGTITDNSVALSWTVILYIGDSGGYEVYFRESGGSETLFDTTAEKSIQNIEVTGLSSGTQYSFRLRTVTYSHSLNPNTLYSDYTDQVSATTTGEAPEDEDEGGCFIGVISFGF